MGQHSKGYGDFALETVVGLPQQTLSQTGRVTKTER